MPLNADNSPNILWPLKEVPAPFKKDNVLPEDMYLELRKKLNDTDWGPNSTTNPYHTVPGRWVSGPEFSVEFREKITEIAKEAWGRDDLEFCFMFTSRYQQHKGVTPYLWEHMDQASSQYTMDLCVEKHLIDDWGVSVEGHTFREDENSAIFFNAQQHAHSRPPYPIDNPDAYMHIFFANFVAPGHWAYGLNFGDMSGQERYDLLEKYKNDGNIRYYEYSGHAPRFYGMPAGNYECVDCMQCYEVPEDFIDDIDGYIHLK